MATANEPAGFVSLNHRPFNAKVELGWLANPTSAFKIQSDPLAPLSPASIGQAHFAAGFKGGSAPINTWYTLAGKKRNLYLSFWFKLSTNWTGHKSGVNKIFFFQIAKGNKVYLTAQGARQGPLHSEIRVQGINETPVSRNLLPNLNNKNILRGQWHHWEVILRSNANGLPNGSADWWLDGVPVGTYSGINFVPATANNYWEAVKWNPTWGGTADTVPAAMDMYMDDAYISAM